MNITEGLMTVMLESNQESYEQSTIQGITLDYAAEQGNCGQLRLGRVLLSPHRIL
jgi:hypothetical protein